MQIGQQLRRALRCTDIDRQIGNTILEAFRVRRSQQMANETLEGSDNLHVVARLPGRSGREAAGAGSLRLGGRHADLRLDHPLDQLQPAKCYDKLAVDPTEIESRMECCVIIIGLELHVDQQDELAEENLPVHIHRLLDGAQGEFPPEMSERMLEFVAVWIAGRGNKVEKVLIQPRGHNSKIGAEGVQDL